MTLISFKTVGVGILSGAAGGAISGALMICAWVLASITSSGLPGLIGLSFSMWVYQLLMGLGGMLLYGLVGAVFGLVIGAVAGLVGALVIMTSGSAENAPTVGKCLGLIIGICVAIYGSTPFGFTSFIGLFLIGGGLSSAYGGGVAGRFGRWLIQDDDVVLARNSSTV